MWLLLTLLSVALGLASVHLKWSGIPVSFGGADFSLTLYPPLTICMLLTLWFGFWWGAIPAFVSTFCLSVYFQMSAGWASLFALSDPIAFAIFVIGYRVISLPLNQRSLHAFLSFALLVFLGGILSSVGTFIWSYTGHYSPQRTLNIWQGWWVGYVVQSLLISTPILLFFSNQITSWRDRVFPPRETLKPLNQRNLLFSVILLLAGIYLFILLSVQLSRNVIQDAVQTLISLQNQIGLWQATSNAVFLVIGFLFFSFAYLGYYLITNWNRKLMSAIAEAEQASSAKAGFLARMSHEIRTPMNAIIGLSELALQHAKESRQKDYLSKIRTSADLLLQLINDVLDFSKSDAGKLQLEQKAFAIEDVLNRVSDQIAFKIAEKDVVFTIELLPDVPRQLVGDNTKLAQILLNLLSNACKFTNSGEIRLRVSCNRIVERQIELQFMVSDSGIGIPPERWQSLFQPFSQADESITRQYGGTGLGLAICKQITEAMKGQIWLESRAGAGSTFKFTAVFQFEDQDQIVQPTFPLSSLISIGNASHRAIALSYLTELGINASVCADGTHLFEAVDSGMIQPDFLLVDVDSHPVESLQRITHLKRADGKPIPCILLTAPFAANIDPELHELHTSNTIFLHSPVLPSKLASAINLLDQDKLPFRRRRSDHPKGEPVSSNYRHLFQTRVLIVEDEPINRQIAEEFLSSIGVMTESAADGSEAINKIRHQRFDAVLMDIHMPVMDGISAARVVRESGLTDLPIIALTAHSLQDVSQLPSEAGFNAFLGKPFLPEQLFEILSSQIAPTPPKKASADTPRPARSSNQITSLGEYFGKLPGIDLEKGLRTVGLAPDRYLNILRKFEQHHGSTAENLRQAYQENQIKEVYRIAHSLKSVGHSIGAERLTALADMLEQSADMNEATEEEVNQLADALEEVVRSLAMLNNRQGN